MIEYFECQCHSPEHRVVFEFEDNEIVLSHFLNHYRSWWQRVWVAIKYVLGYKCKYGHFGVTILKNEDIPRLIKLLEKIQ